MEKVLLLHSFRFLKSASWNVIKLIFLMSQGEKIINYTKNIVLFPVYLCSTIPSTLFKGQRPNTWRISSFFSNKTEFEFYHIVIQEAIGKGRGRNPSRFNHSCSKKYEQKLFNNMSLVLSLYSNTTLDI